MKLINSIITVCFVVVFAGGAYFTANVPKAPAPVTGIEESTDYLGNVNIKDMKKHFPVPAPEGSIEKSLPRQANKKVSIEITKKGSQSTLYPLAD